MKASTDANIKVSIPQLWESTSFPGSKLSSSDDSELHFQYAKPLKIKPSDIPTLAMHFSPFTFSAFLFTALAYGASSLKPRASSPLGFICHYTEPQCAHIPIPEPIGDDSTCVNEVLPLSTCFQTHGNFESFVAGVAVNCASGSVPQVIAYFTTDCTGPAISAGDLPSGGAPSECVDMVPQPGGAQLIGKSAKFGCLSSK